VCYSIFLSLSSLSAATTATEYKLFQTCWTGETLGIRQRETLCVFWSYDVGTPPFDLLCTALVVQPEDISHTGHVLHGNFQACDKMFLYFVIFIN